MAGWRRHRPVYLQLTFLCTRGAREDLFAQIKCVRVCVCVRARARVCVCVCVCVCYGLKSLSWMYEFPLPNIISIQDVVFHFSFFIVIGSFHKFLCQLCEYEFNIVL